MPDFAIENSLSGNIVVGIDEVGRGPLAGPVVAACAFIPDTVKDHAIFTEIRDSKKLSQKKRERLYPYIIDLCEIGLGEASIAEIDQINILQATFLAMERSFTTMTIDIDHVLIDGNKCPKLPCAMTPVIKGDDTSLSIAAASIVAKVTRDRFMAQIHEEHPQYDWINNSGYGTKKHLAALEEFGPTPHHRLSFAPLRQKYFPL